MLRLPLSQATSGMRLALPLLHPERGTVLLSEGFELSESLIRKLRELEIHELWIEYPDTEQIKQYVSPAILNQQCQLVSIVAESFDAMQHTAHAQLEFSNFRKTIQGLIESLVAEPLAASYVVELGGSSASELRHASEVCFLSVLLGLKLQGYLIQQRKRLRPTDARDVVSLGLGAMLHDIGKTSLDPEIRQRFDQTRDETDIGWQQHVVLGHKAISGAISPAAAGVVLHHHQHYDGSGFPVSRGKTGRPRGLSGEDIHVFARIVCVANEFDRLRHPPAGGLIPRVRVLNQLLHGPTNSWFDPVILATLPLVVPAYPAGSIVMLNNAVRAVVMQSHPDAPCRPTVQELGVPGLTPGRQNVDPVRHDLRQKPELWIASHDGVDVTRDNFRSVTASSWAASVA